MKSFHRHARHKQIGWVLYTPMTAMAPRWPLVTNRLTE